jgi:CRP/FNR family transcriptional regulator, anaerobic regulatory protein
MIEKTAEMLITPEVPGHGTALRLLSKVLPSDSPAADERVSTLKVGEALFRSGQSRALVYRIETGVMMVSIGGDERTPRSFNLAEPGDFVGLGFIEHHTSSAFAMTDCVVRSYSPSEFAELAEREPALREQEAAAIAREFDLRKAKCLEEASRKTTAQRLAGYLLVVARMNTMEGRQANIVPESISCDFLTNLFDVSLDDLAAATKELHKAQLIELDDKDRAIIADFERLEDFSNA